LNILYSSNLISKFKRFFLQKQFINPLCLSIGSIASNYASAFEMKDGQFAVEDKPLRLPIDFWPVASKSMHNSSMIRDVAFDIVILRLLSNLEYYMLLQITFPGIPATRISGHLLKKCNFFISTYSSYFLPFPAPFSNFAFTYFLNQEDS